VSDIKVYPVPENLKSSALIYKEQYEAMYTASIETPDTFWAEQATDFLDWTAPFTQVSNCDMAQGDINWFLNGKLNVSSNCIDRHLPARADQVAILWEGDEPGLDRKITYQELHDHVCEMANVLKQRGVKKGDRVCIYMPMIPEAAFAMLACAALVLYIPWSSAVFHRIP